MAEHQSQETRPENDRREMGNVPFAPPRYDYGPVSFAWRDGYLDAVTDKCPDREYETTGERQAYAVGFCSGQHRLFQE